MLLGRPEPWTVETVNDKDCYISNFWRAVKHDPKGLAKACDWPINECDLEARHLWLVTEGSRRIEKCKADPKFYDLTTAAWWVWGLSQWIGAGWCLYAGRTNKVWKKIPSADSRRGVHQKKCTPWKSRPKLKNAMGIFVPWKQKPHLSSVNGINHKLPRIGGCGDMGIKQHDDLQDYFKTIQNRLRLVRVCCGDWLRVTAKSSTSLIGTTAVFLDPPYSKTTGRDMGIYNQDSATVSHQAAEWAFKHGENPKMRIALCGYEGEHKNIPHNWRTFSWKAQGGHSNIAGPDGKGSKNRERERIWFSPHCIEPQPELF